MPTSLARRLVVSNGVFVAALVVIGGASLAGLHRVEEHLLEATEEYEELHIAETAAHHAAVARTLLDLAGKAEQARGELAIAIDAIDRFLEYQDATDDILDRSHQNREVAKAEAARDAMVAAIGVLEDGDGDPVVRAGASTADALDSLEQLVAATGLERIRAKATAETRITITAITILSTAVVAGMLGVSLVAYRMIVRPVRSLGDAAKSIAQGHFDKRIAPPAMRELAGVAHDFNRMASDLEALYRGMEARVERHSRDLVRSERLASVGFLAAGLAHEINNPLGIISGYAELATGWLDGSPPPKRIDEAQEALTTIRDEAFRCKAIVEQLLALSRGGGGDGTRTRVALRRLAEETAVTVRGLQRFRDRHVEVVRGAGDTSVVASEPELRQVLLNLVVNALEAVSPGGNVSIEATAANGEVVVRVRDDGRGLTEDELQHVFEPFFSARSGVGAERGVGLGLTISHAIVERHGGRMTAESEGPGRGSCFTMILPRSSGSKETP